MGGKSHEESTKSPRPCDTMRVLLREEPGECLCVLSFVRYMLCENNQDFSDQDFMPGERRIFHNSVRSLAAVSHVVCVCPDLWYVAQRVISLFGLVLEMHLFYRRFLDFKASALMCGGEEGWRGGGGGWWKTFDLGVCIFFLVKFHDLKWPIIKPIAVTAKKKTELCVWLWKEPIRNSGCVSITRKAKKSHLLKKNRTTFP